MRETHGKWEHPSARGWPGTATTAEASRELDRRLQNACNPFSAAAATVSTRAGRPVNAQEHINVVEGCLKVVKPPQTAARALSTEENCQGPECSPDR